MNVLCVNAHPSIPTYTVSCVLVQQQSSMWCIQRKKNLEYLWIVVLNFSELFERMVQENRLNTKVQLRHFLHVTIHKKWETICSNSQKCFTGLFVVTEEYEWMDFLSPHTLRLLPFKEVCLRFPGGGSCTKSGTVYTLKIVSNSGQHMWISHSWNRLVFNNIKFHSALLAKQMQALGFLEKHPTGWIYFGYVFV